MRTHVIALAALGLALTALPARGSYVEVTPQNINYGEVAIGATSVRLFSVTNVKNTYQDRTVTITAQTVAGTDFSLGSVTCPTTLGIGQSCQVGVAFKPTSTGPKTGTFTLRTSDGEFGKTLAGIGQSAVSVTPTSVDFGRVKVGETDSATVVITNLTTADYFTITATGSSTFPIGNSSATIGPHENATITITFKPLKEGTVSEGMTVSWHSTTGSGVAGSVGVEVRGVGYTQTSTTSESPDLAGCLIATAASGSPLESELASLRGFRDTWLLTERIPLGARFVAWYYGVSPPVAQLLAHNPPLRAATRAVLTPVVLTVNHPAGVLALFLGGVTALLAARRLAHRR